MAEVKGGGVIALDTSSLTSVRASMWCFIEWGFGNLTPDLLSGVHAHTGDKGLCYKLVRASLSSVVEWPLYGTPRGRAGCLSSL